MEEQVSNKLQNPVRRRGGPSVPVTLSHTFPLARPWGEYLCEGGATLCLPVSVVDQWLNDGNGGDGVPTRAVAARVQL